LGAEEDRSLTSIDLVTFCERENVPFVTFNDFNDISAMVKDIVADNVSVTEAAKGRIS